MPHLGNAAAAVPFSCRCRTSDVRHPSCDPAILLAEADAHDRFDEVAFRYLVSVMFGF